MSAPQPSFTPVPNGGSSSIKSTDACDSEPMLMREDNELLPGSGLEIARGNEMNCWYQLEQPAKFAPVLNMMIFDERPSEKLLRQYKLAGRAS